MTGQNVVITITLTEDGNIAVAGVPTDKILAYGVLGTATEVIRKMMSAGDESKIALPKGPISEFFKR